MYFYVKCKLLVQYVKTTMLHHAAHALLVAALAACEEGLGVLASYESETLASSTWKTS